MPTETPTYQLLVHLAPYGFAFAAVWTICLVAMTVALFRGRL